MDKYTVTKNRLSALRYYQINSANQGLSEVCNFSVPYHSSYDKDMEYYKDISNVLFQAHHVIMELVEEQIQKDQQTIDAVEALLGN